MRKTALGKLAISAIVSGLLLASVPSVPARASTPAHDQMVAYKRSHGYLPIGGAFSGTPRILAPAPVGAYRPVAEPTWEGLNQDNLAPPDPTGAIGPNSFVQMINLQMGIYDRNGSLIASSPLANLTASPNFVSDPQVIWDPGSNRFYYVVLDADDDVMFWGFSRDSNPTSLPDGFCNYRTDFGWGFNLPDYPKLGQTSDFLLIGVNLYPSLATYIPAWPHT